ncbi:phytanoyl-CoA dioxygenase family protein [Candidatus Poribacteria bacterium]|nr:phytanoyl-CoA dioxygenase family protein [Candidatus Poribacteria bacterium]MYG05568.1 phytanoyl-CoA dioxygenase family protein [Candidatus Poribacteria bacterium]MYK20811.1 phytanoyl-CoA dioxygenase family protein [Candidatus Poribacteria bacterium]
MLTTSEINDFVENGYIIRKGALSQTDIQTYRSAIDRVLHKCRAEGLHADHLRYIDDETLYIVPGSHRRELTDAERKVLQETPMAEMPNQLAVKLKAGDIVFYNSRIIHKGYNLTSAKRQTLHYAVLLTPPEGTPLNDKGVESQAWLNEPNFLDSLSPRLKPLFDNWLKYG